MSDVYQFLARRGNLVDLPTLAGGELGLVEDTTPPTLYIGTADGNVLVGPLTDASALTAAFTAAETRANIGTGETIAVILGKIAKWFSDFKAGAWGGIIDNLTSASTTDSLSAAQGKALKTYVDDTFADKTATVQHIGDANNPHNVTKAQIGITYGTAAANVETMAEGEIYFQIEAQA